METAIEARDGSRDFWRGVLADAGRAAVPRWTSAPVPGVGEQEAAVPDEVASALPRLAGELGVPVESVLLAGHAKVLSALCGEDEVLAGYVAVQGAPAAPCRLDLTVSSWRGLVLGADRAARDVRTHLDSPWRELVGELGLSAAPFEVVVDPYGADGTPEGDTVLWVGFVRRDGQWAVRVRYRADVLDADAGERIAGYHVTALGLLCADVDAGHTGQGLVGARELRHQLEDLAGPERELPQARAHELFEQRVREHPDSVAAVRGTDTWTYGELNARANRLARALLVAGLRPEQPVGVVTERGLDWLASVWAVFKAGGVYLPVEPHFPPERVRSILTRANCPLVLTEPGSTDHLDQALAELPAVQRLLIDEAVSGQTDASDLDVAVGPNQLAYIYFTSGSTGEPKGAMCEHTGMLNHLHAKIDDLGIGEGTAVAQTAPQCFDISLWQLIAAHLVGGRTVLVDQETILDVPRFLDTIDQQRVNVAQLVPSYLEAVLTHLERHPRPLAHLRYVSVTGEALKRELAVRWFANQPAIALLNAYGLTETSDDTNHELMRAAPERVLLGPPVPNVRIYVADEHLHPVPLGAPGEIVFSGVCVGRGYINDPERTRAAFGTDPYRPGARLYRSGDRGRWHPNGKLEFLGRRDTQVKIRGFRIEIGEIENTLLTLPGIRDAAVTFIDHPATGPHLTAYYTRHTPLDQAELSSALGAHLPAYMVPTTYHHRAELPLTPNGKVDKKALVRETAEHTAPAATPVTSSPTTPTEQRLAAAFAGILGLPADRIGRDDHFFDRGGTSLSAVKLAIALDRAITLKDITAHPVLAELAVLIDTKSGTAAGTGPSSELLQALSRPQSGRSATALVCFPYAGGNAVNFQAMARALQDSGPAVYAVELPGHDPATADSASFAPLDRLVGQVVDEIEARGLGRVMLWGHSSGTAPALETARRLEERGVEVQRVFLGAQLLGDAATRRAAIDELAARGNAGIAAELGGDSGYSELGEQLDPRHAEQVGAAYRHDCVSAHRYFADAMDAPPSVKLSAPVTVIVAADDPHTATAEPGEAHLGWQLLAERVELFELPDGGHYFLRTRPTEAAKAVLHAADWPTP
ncbi:amino acid adenylation domain-containing protein [Streptomyces sp. NPDC059828]|uniref:non-ribosomal peptide synthetase n=1 Tax=Streptomyces sp. NPDC059828 TaxID=3346965 RepID=UPI0036672A17